MIDHGSSLLFLGVSELGQVPLLGGDVLRDHATFRSHDDDRWRRWRELIATPHIFVEQGVEDKDCSGSQGIQAPCAEPLRIVLGRFLSHYIPPSMSHAAIGDRNPGNKLAPT